jgi:hypothetical protein
MREDIIWDIEAYWKWGGAVLGGEWVMRESYRCSTSLTSSRWTIYHLWVWMKLSLSVRYSFFS